MHPRYLSCLYGRVRAQSASLALHLRTPRSIISWPRSLGARLNANTMLLRLQTQTAAFYPIYPSINSGTAPGPLGHVKPLVDTTRTGAFTQSPDGPYKPSVSPYSDIFRRVAAFTSSQPRNILKCSKMPSAHFRLSPYHASAFRQRVVVCLSLGDKRTAVRANTMSRRLLSSVPVARNSTS